MVLVLNTETWFRLYSTKYSIFQYFAQIFFLGYNNPLVFPSQTYQEGGYYHPLTIPPQTYNAGVKHFYYGLNQERNIPTCGKAILR